MTKIENYNKAYEYGRDAGFVANVIINWHSNPGKKLSGLVKLLERGASIRTGSFSIDTLIVNGDVMPWKELETVR